MASGDPFVARQRSKSQGYKVKFQLRALEAYKFCKIVEARLTNFFTDLSRVQRATLTMTLTLKIDKMKFRQHHSVLLFSGSLLCGFNVPVKGLNKQTNKQTNLFYSHPVS